jgi:hypothetical protein
MFTLEESALLRRMLRFGFLVTLAVGTSAVACLVFR